VSGSWIFRHRLFGDRFDAESMSSSFAVTMLWKEGNGERLTGDQGNDC
jgi:hypothetical protein